MQYINNTALLGGLLLISIDLERQERNGEKRQSCRKRRREGKRSSGGKEKYPFLHFSLFLGNRRQAQTDHRMNASLASHATILSRRSGTTAVIFGGQAESVI